MYPAITGVDFDDRNAIAIIHKGYAGAPEDWCYFDAEYPHGGAYGPFSCREAAVSHANANGYQVEEEAP